MAKVIQQPRTGLYPTPAVLVSSMDQEGRPNIIAIAWAGVACSQPPMIGIGVNKLRYSHALIRDRGEFVVNVPSASLLEAVDRCGTLSGRDVTKFEAASLTPAPATEVKVPLIAECPVNLECKVRHQLGLGTHDLFLGEYWTLKARVAQSGFTRKVQAAKTS